MRVLYAASMMLIGCFIFADAEATSCPNDAVCEAYTYDLHGRLIEVDREEKSGSTTVETVNVVYDHDAAGNLTKKETTVTP